MSKGFLKNQLIKRKFHLNLVRGQKNKHLIFNIYQFDDIEYLHLISQYCFNLFL